jgi:hypothetical protein
MDLPKLLSVLMRRELHLTRLDQLKDKFEGTLPLQTRSAFAAEFRKVFASPNAEPLMADFLKFAASIGKNTVTPPEPEPSMEMLEFFRQLMKWARALAISRVETQTGKPVSAEEAAQRSPQELFIESLIFVKMHGRAPVSLDEITQPTENSRTPLEANEKEALIDEMIDNLFSWFKAQRQQLFVNCWHIGDLESEAMWRTYCGGDDGVAVGLPYAVLRDSIDERNTYIGMVDYINFHVELFAKFDVLSAAMHKRKEFEFEGEARIARWRHNTPDDPGPLSVKIGWRPDDMIEKIIISPYATPWFADTVRDVVGLITPNLRCRVQPSSMSGEPT